MANKAPQQRPGQSEQSVSTPPEFVIAVWRRLGIQWFTWDLAAEAHNAKAEQFYREQDNGLTQPWPRSGWNWLNPEFNNIAAWVKRAYEQGILGAHTAVLIPASIGANWWIEHVEGKAAIIPLNGRIVFEGHTAGYPKDCALLLYGPDIEPGFLPAWDWVSTLTPEEKQDMKDRIAKTKAEQGESPKVRKIAEGRKKKRTPPPEVISGETALTEETSRDGAELFGRVTTFAPNAPETMEPAPDLPSVDLGPILLPSPEDAVRVLAELAGLNDRALSAKAVYDTLKERTKAAKEKYDALAELVITRLRVSTHASDMPLFDQGDDLAAMLAADKFIEQVDANDLAAALTAASGASVEVTGEAHDAMYGQQPQESADQEIAPLWADVDVADVF